MSGRTSATTPAVGLPASRGRSAARGRAARTVALALAGTAVLAGPGRAQAPAPVTIAVGAPTAGALPLWLAADRGCFAAEGLTADLRLLRNGQTTLAALLAGQVDVASVAATQIVGPVVRGADLVVVAGLVDRLPYRLVTAARVRRPEDLKGGRIGVNSASGAAQVAARLALERLGLDPRRDRVWLVQIGPEPERLAALAAGSIDAALLSFDAEPRLPQAGIRTLVDLRTDGRPWLHTSLVTRRAVLRERPAVIRAVLRAATAGLAVALDPAEAPAVRAVLRRRLGLDDPAALDAVYRDFVAVLARNPVPRPEAAAGVLAAMASTAVLPGAAALRGEDLVEPAIMRALEREGWLERPTRPGR